MCRLSTTDIQISKLSRCFPICNILSVPVKPQVQYCHSLLNLPMEKDTMPLATCHRRVSTERHFIVAPPYPYRWNYYTYSHIMRFFFPGFPGCKLFSKDIFTHKFKVDIRLAWASKSGTNCAWITSHLNFGFSNTPLQDLATHVVEYAFERKGLWAPPLCCAGMKKHVL